MLGLEVDRCLFWKRIAYEHVAGASRANARLVRHVAALSDITLNHRKMCPTLPAQGSKQVRSTALSQISSLTRCSLVSPTTNLATRTILQAWVILRHGIYLSKGRQLHSPQKSWRL